MTREMTAMTQDETQPCPLALVGENRLRKPGRLQGSGCPVWGLIQGMCCSGSHPSLSLLKGVNEVERSLAVAKSPWQLSKCHCLCSLPSVLDLRLALSPARISPFPASVPSQLQLGTEPPSTRRGLRA